VHRTSRDHSALRDGSNPSIDKIFGRVLAPKGAMWPEFIEGKTTSLTWWEIFFVLTV